jgi:cyclopropane fatty-acyl-phospholipid synthase-like methyltransferase
MACTSASSRVGATHAWRKMDPRKALVRDAYDAIAGAWGEARRATAANEREQRWLDRFLASQRPGARLLDLGCGVGVPILAKLVARGYRAFGVDFSRGALREARSNCPGSALIRADLTEIEFAPGSFRGAIAYDSIWHTPRREHAGVMARLRSWLVDGGAVLLTLAATASDDGERFTDLMGAPIYYDAIPVAESLRLLQATGFTVVDHHLEPLGAATPSSGHLIVLARAT